jgi:arsenate reductase
MKYLVKIWIYQNLTMVVKMNKKVLIMCTGNSCRSIIGEALINKYMDGAQAYSCGVKPSGRVHESAKKILKENDAWDETYHSKHLDDLLHVEFNLVVTVCDHANETCPMFPKKTKVLHVGFVDPDGLSYEAFEQTYKEIKKVLLPKVKEALS